MRTLDVLEDEMRATTILTAVSATAAAVCLLGCRPSLEKQAATLFDKTFNELIAYTQNFAKDLPNKGFSPNVLDYAKIEFDAKLRGLIAVPLNISTIW